MSQRFTIVRADKSHAGQIQSLWAEVFRITVADKRYCWLYELAPYDAIAYVAIEEATKSVVGMSALYLCAYRLGERLMKVGIAADFAVVAKHRVFGPARELQRHVMSSADTHELDFILAYPNIKALKLMLAAGYTSLSKTAIYAKHLKPYNAIHAKVNNSLLASLGSLAYTLYTRTAEVFSALFAIGLNVVVAGAQEQLQRDLREFSGSGANYADLIKLKSAEYLQWRYVNNPTNKIVPLVIRDTNRNLYAIAFVSINASKLVIIDLIGHPGILRYLRVASAISGYSRSLGVSTIETVFLRGSSLKISLILNGFLGKRYDRELLIYPKTFQHDFMMQPEDMPIFEADMDI